MDDHGWGVQIRTTTEVNQVIRRVIVQAGVHRWIPPIWCTPDQTGNHVLMTVEEYRERIEAAYIDGWTDREGCFNISFTRRQLDADLGGEG